ncbi:hypothetical protein MCM1_0694 [Methanosarcina barkeri CM1]|uniref:Uncharacterized protein n=1 Tax=Methanosarcina barkeri CM1 TaxID=796385 RepID=A0A0G3CD37_METBA|nr:hypothetical protein MCM1_0694 [Methanosarcina barkeri CM1]
MKNYIIIIILGILFTVLTRIALAENTKTYDAETFRQALELD